MIVIRPQGFVHVLMHVRLPVTAILVSAASLIAKVLGPVLRIVLMRSALLAVRSVRPAQQKTVTLLCPIVVHDVVALRD